LTDEYINIPEPLKGFDSEKTKILIEKIHKEKWKLYLKNNPLQLFFKEFWNLCENPIPVVFKYKNRYLITRDTNKIKEVKELAKDEQMSFVDVIAIPIKHGGRQSKDWLSIFAKIPVGKAWTPKVKGVQTIREAINKLVKEKQLVDGEFEVMQRTVGKEVVVYVAHNKLK